MHRQSEFSFGSISSIITSLDVDNAQDRNVILGLAQELRTVRDLDTNKEDLTSRFVGLIVVPGQHINKIELEEFDRSGII